MILNKHRLTKQSLPAGRLLLSMDFGSKVIGFAISDKLLWGASPLASWTRKKLAKDDLQHCSHLLELHHAAALVVGWPLRSDGAESEICKAVLRFCERLEPLISVPIILWDERFSSLGAEKTLKAQGYRGRKIKTKIDKYAASHLLQGFLDYWQNFSA